MCHHMIDSLAERSGRWLDAEQFISPLRMFFRICSVSRLPFLRQPYLSMATLAQMSMQSGAPGPMESSIIDKVPTLQ